MPKFDKAMEKRMRDTYGTTTNVRRTAYVLRDGSKITYAGTSIRHHSDMAREVGASGVDDFMCRTGAIKLHDWGNSRVVAACGYKPTTAQRKVLDVYVPSSIRDPKEVNMDVYLPIQDSYGDWQYGGNCHLVRQPRGEDAVNCILREGRVTGSRLLTRSAPKGSGRPPKAIRFF
jgi:hypothetical protein